MGVPQFFHWLTTHYDRHLLFDQYPHNTRPKYLYLDFNCGIHPAVKKPELMGKTSFDSLEEMYFAVSNYLDKIIKAVNPSKMVYIAIDGVAPVAKMKQQRMRRFKAVQDRHELDRIDSKHKCYQPSKYDFNMISPGTQFMLELTEHLKQHIEKILCPKYPYLNIILDDAENPGEGEHKITHHLRNNVAADDSVVVYGLDSDLIFLCLLNYRKQFCLFREKIFFDHGDHPPDQYTFLDVNEFRKILLSIMTPSLNREDLDGWGILNTERNRALNQAELVDIDSLNKEKKSIDKNQSTDDFDDYEEDESKTILEKNRDLDLEKFRTNLELSKDIEDNLILDYTALCFILGNDFLPHLPSLKIKEGGLNRAIECYKSTQENLPNKYLVNQQEFDLEFLTEFINRIADYEEVDMIKCTEASQLRRAKFRNGYRLRGLTPRDKEVQMWEYVENQYRDKLRLGQPDWKDRYYQYYLGPDYQPNLDHMIKDYFYGLNWTLKYYQGYQSKETNHMHSSCPDWIWKYDYLVAPAASDMIKALKNGLDVNKIKLDHEKRSQPLISAEQLMLIFPPQSKELVDPKLAKLMTNIDSPIFDQYPQDFEIDLQGHRYRWECYPILPELDITKTCQCVRLILNKNN